MSFLVWKKISFKSMVNFVKFIPRQYRQDADGMWYCFNLGSVTNRPVFCGVGVTKNDAFIDYKSKLMLGLISSNNHPVNKVV